MRMRSFAVLLLTAGIYAAGANAKGNVIEGVISGFECADNCYLTVNDAGGKRRTGLCAAALCRKWNENTTMPEKFKGRKVRITVGKGKQYDGEGNVAGKMDSFNNIELLPEAQ